MFPAIIASNKALIGNPVEARDFRAWAKQNTEHLVAYQKSMNLIIHAVTYQDYQAVPLLVMSDDLGFPHGPNRCNLAG